jgi:hypothetical protein
MSSQNDDLDKFLAGMVEVSIKGSEAVLNYIAGRFSPEDVFSDKTLENWAYDNGMIYLSECVACEECEDCSDKIDPEDCPECDEEDCDG